MRPFPIEELVDRVGSAYSVVVAAAKRAKQIKEGAPPLVQVDSRNPLTIALHEIALGQVNITEPLEPEEQAEAAEAAREGVAETATKELPDLPLVDLAEIMEGDSFEEAPPYEEDEDDDEDLEDELDEDLEDDLEDEDDEDWSAEE